MVKFWEHTGSFCVCRRHAGLTGPVICGLCTSRFDLLHRSRQAPLVKISVHGRFAKMRLL